MTDSGKCTASINKCAENFSIHFSENAQSMHKRNSVYLLTIVRFGLWIIHVIVLSPMLKTDGNFMRVTFVGSRGGHSRAYVGMSSGTILPQRRPGLSQPMVPALKSDPKSFGTGSAAHANLIFGDVCRCPGGSFPSFPRARPRLKRRSSRGWKGNKDSGLSNPVNFTAPAEETCGMRMCALND